MLRLANTELRYGAIALVLHWGMAVLLVALAALGLYMVRLPDVGFDRTKITLILVHKAIGMLALLLVIARLAWRWTNALPKLAPGLPDWQQVAARFVHLLFYVFMLALPLTGWLMSSAGAYPVSFFGWFAVPDLIEPNERWFEELTLLHRWLADGLLVLLALHAGAALRHHFVFKDDTLRRMGLSCAGDRRINSPSAGDRRIDSSCAGDRRIDSSCAGDRRMGLPVGRRPPPAVGR